MNKLERRGYRKAAKRTLRETQCNPRKLVLLHTGAAAGVTLLVSVIVYILQMQLEKATGIRGMEKRSMITTAQMILQTLPSLLMPFWSMGYLHTILKINKGWSARPYDLTEGFGRFGPVLRLELILAILCGAMAFAATQVATTLYMYTDWSQSLLDTLLAFYEDPTNRELELALNGAIWQAMPVILTIAFVGFAALFILFFYRFRFARMHLMNDPEKGAFAAMRASAKMMRGKRGSILRLDLSFWWFYLLEILAALLCNGDLALELLGVKLPWNPAIWYFGFLLLSLLAQILLHVCCKNEVYGTFAKVFLTMEERDKEETQ